MSEKSRNIIFVACVISTLTVLGFNAFMCNKVEKTFTSLYNEAAKAQQIMVAQDYASQVATLAEYEASRAHELEEQINELAIKYMQVLHSSNDLVFQLELNQFTINAQASYIGQLIELLKANNIDVPEPDLKDRTVAPWKDVENDSLHMDDFREAPLETGELNDSNE